ncbi:MAG: phosphatidylglycerophosphate synthase [Myxococcota bacterium]|jgi:phosphatidylglycerophosphate synthase
MKPTVLIYKPSVGSSERKLLGLTLRDRLNRSCMRDGAAQVLPIDRAHEAMPGPIVILPSTLVADQYALGALLAERAECGVSMKAGAPIARFDTRRAVSDDLVAAPEATLAARSEDLELTGFAHVVTSRREGTTAEKALLQSLRKPVDGLISRTINRPVSLFTTRWLARTGVTPNQWTIVTAILGVLGGLVMGQGGYLMLTLGAFLIHVSSVLDGCDGEIARIKFKSSKIGEWLDTIADDIVNSSLILGLGFGIAATTGQNFYAGLSVVGVGLYLAYTSVVYHHLITRAQTGYALDFKWWFEEDNADANTMTGKLGSMDILKLALRRDFFVFFFFVLTALTLPQVALWLSFIGAVATFTLACTQTVMMRTRQSNSGTTRTALK